MRALSIRQPFAELILRGIKTVEYRSRSTRIIGERFWLYASKGVSHLPLATGHLSKKNAAWSRDLAMPTENLPAWMIELAEQVGMIEPDAILPMGVIVGSAVIEKVTEINDEVGTMNDEVKASGNLLHRSSFIVPRFRWHLASVERAKSFRKPERHPQPVWFMPF